MASHLERFVNKYGRLPTEVDPDYLEMLQMSKYRILNLPDLNPAKCANCGGHKNDGRKYIDFGLTVDWYGIVYLCGNCVKEIAEQMGYIKEEKPQIDTLPILKGNTEEAISKLEEVLNGFYEYANKLGLDIDTSYMEYNTDDSDVSTTDKSDVDKTESGTAEPSTGPRREDVRSLAELLRDSGS